MYGLLKGFYKTNYESCARISDVDLAPHLKIASPVLESEINLASVT